MLPFELTKDTPYLALSGELWSVFYEYFNRNWSCYKGFPLYSRTPLWHDRFSSKYSQKTSHSSPVRARYRVSFVSSKPDPYPTPVDVVVYLISAIMNRVIKRFYCTMIDDKSIVYVHTLVFWYTGVKWYSMWPIVWTTQCLLINLYVSQVGHWFR